MSTTDGGTTTVEPKTRTGTATADLFGDSSSCTLTVEQTEGPYYFDADSIRSDIREDREGTRLRLAIRVRDADSCEPLKNAVVDLWHCDALGSYSGFEAASGGGPGGGGRTDDEKYLRGAQVTNADGIVEFVTVYPGWYQGRTVHIHGKVHVDNQTAADHPVLLRRQGLRARVRGQSLLAAQRPRRAQRQRQHLRRRACSLTSLGKARATWA